MACGLHDPLPVLIFKEFSQFKSELLILKQQAKHETLQWKSPFILLFY